ncbi:MAG: DUF488 domain-containing protein [Thermomicrobiales bacterium]
MGSSVSRKAAEAIHLKRAYDAPEPGDGVRVLVDRLWARGIAKAAAGLDAWMAALGPSDALRTWFGHQPDRWTDFAEKYRVELSTPPRQTLLAALQGVAGHATLTLVYGARDTKENEAVVLRQYLLQERARPAAGWDAPTTLLVVMAVVAAAHHDAVAPASGVQVFASPLLTPDEIADASSTLLSNGLLQAISGGWKLTTRAQKQVRQLHHASDAASGGERTDPPGAPRATQRGAGSPALRSHEP